MDMEVIKTFLTSPALVVLVVAQGFVFAGVFIYLIYKLFSKLGERFIAATEQQAGAVGKIADGVVKLTDGMETLKAQAQRDDDFAREVRITMMSLDAKIERLEDKINIMLGAYNERGRGATRTD
jgi:hypothetical protein